MCDDVDAYVDNAVELYLSEEKWTKARDIAEKTLEDRFYDEVGRNKLREMLLSVGFSAQSTPETVAETVMGLHEGCDLQNRVSVTDTSLGKGRVDDASQFVYPDPDRLSAHRNRDYMGSILWMQQLRATQYMSMMLEQKQASKRDSQREHKSTA